MLDNNASLQSREDFKDSPAGQYKYWCVELAASEKYLKSFIRQGNKIVDKYLALPGSGNTDTQASRYGFKLNLFYANTTTLISTMYGQIPKVDVCRRYADANDDIGRVAAEIMERLLNNDMAENGQETDSVLRANLEDRLTVGLGVAKVRYEADFNEADEVTDERAPIDYVHWRDVRWGWARNFAEIPWIAFREYMKKEEVADRFGKETAEKLQYKVQQMMQQEEDGFSKDDDSDDAWMKAEIWEIWDKTKRQVVWYSPGYDRVLDTKDDPLELSGFWPCPPFFIANCTSTLYVPTSDYHLAQDLYNEIDKLQTRISIITEAVKVVGVYDSSNGEIARMFNETTDNDLIPVKNWALFAEKGGIQGQVDWFPIQDVVSALVQLTEMRDQTIGLLQQVTGMNDLMRGELSNQYEGVGQTQIKAQYGSMRIQALQDGFARYASDLMQIKAEVIARHFSPQTIALRANAEYLNDRDLIIPAIELIKNPIRARLQTKIETENLAMADYAKLRDERTGYITALATFMQSAAPLMEMEPSSTPYLLQLLQWGLAGFKGSADIEGVIDKAIEDAKKAQQEKQGQPDPQMQVEQAKAQAAQQLEQMKIQGEIQKIQAKMQADIEVRKADADADMQTNVQEHMMEMEKLQVEMISTLTEIKAKLQADIDSEVAQSQANILQTQATAEAEVAKDLASTGIEIRKEAAKSQMKIEEIEEQSKAKMKEAAASAKAKPAEAKKSD